MIKVTKFDGKQAVINADLIQFIEETPDTVITLTNGKKIMVKDHLDEVIKLVEEYKRNIFREICILGKDKE